MDKKFNSEQIKILSAWEDNFRTAINARWARNPGRAALRIIHDIYTSVTGDTRRLSDNCGTCILALLTDCGNLYFKSLEDARTDKVSTKAVATQQGPNKPMKKAKVKTSGKKAGNKEESKEAE